ncbi:MAG: SRPBCC family protein [Proteobacteria bacterium]|nr:SRPBCC family protein [Pseudomonadota bacterium]
MTTMVILIITALALGLAVLAGSRLPKTHVCASRQRLEVPVDVVWEKVTNFADYPKWRPGLARVDAGPLLDGQPSWFEYCAPRVKVQLQFIEFKPKTRLVTRLVGDKLPIYGAWEYEFTEDDGATILTITEIDKVYNPLLRLLTRVVFPHNAAMDVFLIALARHCGVTGNPVHLSLRVDGESPVEAA